MPTKRVGRRPSFIPEGATILDARTPGATAKLFVERFYPRPKYYLSHDASGFSVSTGGPAYCVVAKDDIAAQVFRFLSESVDASGETFHPSQARVRAVLWALAMACRRVHIPLPCSDGGGAAQRYA